MERTTLIDDILYSMAGLDSTRICIRKGKKVEVSLHKSIRPDDVHIINNLLDILIGVREIRYCIEEMYYTKEHIKQCFLMGIEKELTSFFDRVCALRRVHIKGELSIEALPFFFQCDISLFKAIRSAHREIDRADSMSVLQIVLDSNILSALDAASQREEVSPLLSLITNAINEILISLVEGKNIPEYFEVRKKYGYGECFWSSYFRVKTFPSFLQDRIEYFYTLAKLSKARKVSGEQNISFTGHILTAKHNTVEYNEENITKYAEELYKAPLLAGAWKETINEIFSALLLDVDRYSLLLSDLDEAVYLAPTKEVVMMTNYVLRIGKNTYSGIEGQIDSGNLSFLADTPFLEEFFANETTAQISYIHNPVSFSQTLTSIQEMRLGKNIYPISYLQGLSILFKPNNSMCLFFSARSISEIQLLFRLIFSFYAVEHFLCSKTGRSAPTTILRHYLVCFTSAMRMYLTERIEIHRKTLLEEKDPTFYCSTLERVLSLMMKESLLTVPSLVHFYCSFFSNAFFYLELIGKDSLRREEIHKMLEEYKEMAASALPYIKSSAALVIFETLAGK